MRLIESSLPLPSLKLHAGQQNSLYLSFYTASFFKTFTSGFRAYIFQKYLLYLTSSSIHSFIPMAIHALSCLPMCSLYADAYAFNCMICCMLNCHCSLMSYIACSLLSLHYEFNYFIVYSVSSLLKSVLECFPLTHCLMLSQVCKWQARPGVLGDPAVLGVVVIQSKYNQYMSPVGVCM